MISKLEQESLKTGQVVNAEKLRWHVCGHGVLVG